MVNGSYESSQLRDRGHDTSIEPLCLCASTLLSTKHSTSSDTINITVQYIQGYCWPAALCCADWSVSVGHTDTQWLHDTALRKVKCSTVDIAQLRRCDVTAQRAHHVPYISYENSYREQSTTVSNGGVGRRSQLTS